MAAIAQTASILNRSKSLPQVIRPNLVKKLISNDQDSGLSSFKEEEPEELCSSIAEHIENQNGEEEKKSQIQGDFASGGSGMLASEPQSQVDSGAHSEVAVVKQLVINTIDKKLKDLRTLKQHYYPEGGWGYVLVVVTLIVQVLVHGAQIAIASFLIGASTSTKVPSSRLLHPDVAIVEVTYGLAGRASDAGKNRTSLCQLTFFSPFSNDLKEKKFKGASLEKSCSRLLLLLLLRPH